MTEPCKKRLNRSRCRLKCGLGLAQGTIFIYFVFIYYVYKTSRQKRDVTMMWLCENRCTIKTRCGSRAPHGKGQFWGRKAAGSGDARTCGFTQSDSAGGNTGTVRMPIGVHYSRWGCTLAQPGEYDKLSLCGGDAGLWQIRPTVDHLFYFDMIYPYIIPFQRHLCRGSFNYY